MSRFTQALVCLLAALPATAQSQRFAKITIQPARSADAGNTRMQVLPNGDLIAHGVSLVVLLSYAYDVPSNPSPRLSSVPDWGIVERYDIEGKAPTGALRLRDGDSHGLVQQMVRGLLADRFHLVLRTENKAMAAYALTVASGGPRLETSAISEKDCIFDTGPQGCHNFAGGLGHPLKANAIDMDDLAQYIENWTDLPVANRTGLRGLFSTDTEGWLPMRLPPPPPDAAPDPSHFAGLPTIFTVLGKLGLELHRQEETLPQYTIEHVERPAAN